MYEFIRELCGRSLDLGAYPISENCGKLLKLIVNLLSEARGEVKAVEVGSGIGCSTLWIAAGIIESNGKGMIYAIEKDSERYSKLKRTIEEAMSRGISQLLGRIVKTVYGDARKIIPKFNFNVDFAFLDGSKEEYVDYLKLLAPKMKAGSILTAHNVISHRGLLKEFIELITSGGWETIIVPVDAGGLSISLKILGTARSFTANNPHINVR